MKNKFIPNIDYSAGYDIQLAQLVKRHSVGYVRILETNECAGHLLDYVKSHEKNAVFPYSEEKDLRILAANILDDRTGFSMYVKHQCAALDLKKKVYRLPCIDQVAAVYKDQPEHFGTILAKNTVFSYLKDYIERHDLNCTRIFKNAPFLVKVVNLIKGRTELSYGSKEKYDSWVMDSIMEFLDGNPKAQIAYLARQTNRVSFIIKKRYKKLVSEIFKFTDFLPDCHSFNTRCWCVLHDIKSMSDPQIKCHASDCINSVIHEGYDFNSVSDSAPKYCCVKCRANDEDYKKTLSNAIEAKYGVMNASQSDEIQAVKKQTMMQLYGVEYPAQNPEIYKKCRSPKLKNTVIQSGIMKK